MQRVKGRRQHFTRKRPATESIWIPKRHMAMPHGVDPKAEPAIGVVDPFRPCEQSELVRQEGLPIEERSHHCQQSKPFRGRSVHYGIGGGSSRTFTSRG